MGFRTHFLFWKKLVVDNFSLADKVREVFVKEISDKSLELVQVEVVGSNKNPTIRVFIDKKDGITHGDCSGVSLKVGEVLDEKDFISSAYMLEVSSPGIERGLYSLDDFEKFANQLAKVKTKASIGGQYNFKGRIVGVEEQEIVFDDKTVGTVRFSYSNVKKANLEIDFEKDLKRAGQRKS